MKVPRLLRAAASSVTLTLAACGGGPTEPPVGTPEPSDVHAVTVAVFEDENRNGRHDAGEDVWIPEAEVEIAAQTGRTARRTGRATIERVPRGTHAATVRAASLPPYYTAGAAVTVESPAPAGVEVKVPVILPIGANMRAGVYFVSGDSISQGESSSTGLGFRPILQDRLLDYFARGQVIYRGGGGGRTIDGALRLDRDMDGIRPAYTVLNWGVNDWHEPGCGNPASTDCPLATNLRSMIRTVRAYGSLPVLVSIIPCNVGYNDECTAARNTWVKSVNDVIRQLARTEGLVMIDAADAFLKQPSLSALFVDHVHPNDAGYQVLADVYFQGLTHGTVPQ